jgi:hypothetical protein
MVSPTTRATSTPPSLTFILDQSVGIRATLSMVFQFAGTAEVAASLTPAAANTRTVAWTRAKLGCGPTLPESRRRSDSGRGVTLAGAN